MFAQLVASKYRSPPLNLGRVPRARLLSKMNEGLRNGIRLTLISAPAGYGKTTLLMQWVADLCHEMPDAPSVPMIDHPSSQADTCTCAWLTLDDGDNDPLRFLACLIAALQHAACEIRTAARLMQSDDLPNIDGLLPELTNELADAPGQTVIVFDDYHEISAQAVHDIVAFLLRYAPANLHLVIATRVDPPLALAQLRGRGQLTELRQDDLRFTLNEAVQLLSATVTPTLHLTMVERINVRAEGWAAGLQMAAISLQDRVDIEQFVRAFSGSHRHIMDYLSDEVLNGLPPSTQRFLMETAILDRLCAPLCAALLGEATSIDEMQMLLEQFEQANLFVVPLDDQRLWYRYHHLFSDLLRRQLSATEPTVIPELHRRASHWYETSGLMHEAVEHALAAEDYNHAADLIAHMAESVMKSSEVATLRRWVEALPAEIVKARPMLSVYYGGVLLLMGDSLEIVEVRLRDAFGKHPTGGTGGAASAFQALLATLQGKNQDSDRLAHRALALLPGHSPFFRGCVSLIAGMNQLFAGEDAAATASLHETIQLADSGGDIMNAVLARCYLGELRILQGRLHTARELYEQALADGKDEPIGGLPLMGLGLLHYDWNNLAHADALTSSALERIAAWSELPIAQGALILARIKELTGDPDSARELERGIDEVAMRCTSMTPLHRSIHLYRMRHALWKQDLARAEHHAELAGLSDWSLDQDVAESGTMESTFVLLSAARLRLAQERYEEASAAASSLVARSESRGRLRLVAKGQIIQALAQFGQGNQSGALEALGRALYIAAPEQSIRLFVDEGEPMAELLLLCRQRHLFGAYAGQLSAAFGSVVRVTDGSEPALHVVKNPTEYNLVLEPLSSRETEVLVLMADGRSNGEISQRLGITKSTVKSHVHSIFRKLDAERRTQAIAHARARHLV